jgi:hypothetical protein
MSTCMSVCFAHVCIQISFSVSMNVGFSLRRPHEHTVSKKAKPELVAEDSNAVIRLGKEVATQRFAGWESYLANYIDLNYWYGYHYFNSYCTPGWVFAVARAARLSPALILTPICRPLQSLPILHALQFQVTRQNREMVGRKIFCRDGAGAGRRVRLVKGWLEGEGVWVHRGRREIIQEITRKGS